VRRESDGKINPHPFFLMDAPLNNRLHPTALIDPKAELASDVEVGPFTVIGPHVQIGQGSRVGAHANLTGHTTIGKTNQIFHSVSIGEVPQDKKYAGEITRLDIGDNNTIREFCTINCGTVQDGGVTRIGNDNWIMAYVHVAHDCQVGNHAIFANCTQLAGHVHIGDYAILGGFTGVHQFVRIGAHCMTGISSVVVQDIPPYITVAGTPTRAYSINAEGLKRRGFDAATLLQLKRAYKILYRSGHTLAEAIALLQVMAQSEKAIEVLVAFLSVPGRGIIR